MDAAIHFIRPSPGVSALFREKAPHLSLSFVAFPADSAAVPILCLQLSCHIKGIRLNRTNRRRRPRRREVIDLRHLTRSPPLRRFPALQQYATEAPFFSCRHLLTSWLSLRCEGWVGGRPFFVPPFSHGTFKTSPVGSASSPNSLTPLYNYAVPTTHRLDTLKSYSFQKGSSFER